jgi:hypothetical protein
VTGSATNGAGYGPFAYLAAPNAPLYRRIMRALLVEKERFTGCDFDTVHVDAERSARSDVDWCCAPWRADAPLPAT